jgi:hypothetical protein
MNKLTHLSQKSIELVETIWVTFWARLLIVRAQFPNQLKECWYGNGSSYSIASFRESK